MEGNVWHSQQLQSLQFPVSPSCAMPDTLCLPTPQLVQYGSSPACSMMTLASNTVSTMMTPCNVPPSLQASAIAMPSGVANSQLIASACAQSVETYSSVPSSSNNQAMLMPSNMVSHNMFVHTSMTNQSMMLQAGLPNPPMPMHHSLGNSILPFSNPPHMLGHKPIVETNITVTQKIVIPNLNTTNCFMPNVAVPYSSYNVDIKPENNSFVTNVADETCGRVMGTSFSNTLQPNYGVKLDPVFTSDMNHSQMQLQHSGMHIKYDASCSPVSDMRFLQQTSHSAFVHVSPDIPMPGMVVSGRDTIPSCGGALNFDSSQLARGVSYQSSREGSSDSVMLCLEPSLQVADNGNRTESLATNIGMLQCFTSGVKYSYQQMSHSMSSSQQQITPAAIGSSQVVCSSNLSGQAALTVHSSQQGTSNSNLSHSVISSTDLSQQVTPITHKLQNFAISMDMPHQELSTGYSPHITPNGQSSQLATDYAQQATLAESSQMLAFNVSPVQEVSRNTTDLQNVARVVDVSQQVPQSMASLQRVVSQVMQHAGTSTVSSQGFSSVAYSEHFAFSANSLQLPTGKAPVQFAASVVSPEQLAPDVDHIHSILPHDIKIKTEHLVLCTETNVADSDLPSSGADPLEVKGEPKLEETETVCCDEFIRSDSRHCATPQIKTDPLSTIPTVVSSPATSLIPYNQGTRIHSTEVVDDVSSLATNGYSPQIMILLPPIHMGDGFQNTDNSQAFPGAPVPAVNGCPALENHSLPTEGGTTNNADPALGCLANPSSLHIPPEALEVGGKIPIPRLKVNKPVPPPKPPVLKVPKPVTIPKPLVQKKILPRRYDGTSATWSPPEVIESDDGADGTSDTELLFVDCGEHSDLDNLPKLWVYVPDTRQKEKNKPTSSVQEESQKQTNKSNNKHVASDSNPDGSCLEASLEAVKKDKVAVTPPNNKIQNYSADGQNNVQNTSLDGLNNVQNTSLCGQNQVQNSSLVGQKKAQNSSLAGQKKAQNSSLVGQNKENLPLDEKMLSSMMREALARSRKWLKKKPSPGDEVLSNDKSNMMSIICGECIAEEMGNYLTGYPDQEKAYKCDRCQTPGYQYYFKYKYSQAYLRNEENQKVKDQVGADGSNDDLSETKLVPQRCSRKADSYICNICGSSFKSNMGYYYHYAKHTNIFRYRCEECGQGFHYKSSLVKHSVCHATDSKYHCPLCFKKLKSKEALRQHLKVHVGLKTFVCKWCGQVYRYARSYRLHIQKVHKIVTGEQCKTCLQYFENLNFHKCAPFYECDKCGKRFSKRYAMQMHFVCHTDTLKSKCNICHKVYRDIGKLRCHMRSHSSSWSERYPYLCEVCGRGFSYGGTLVKHRQVHFAGRKYRCKYFWSNIMLQEQCFLIDKRRKRIRRTKK